MSLTTLALFKAHVRADDFTADDVLLQHYLDAAESSVVRYTNRDLDELVRMGEGVLPIELQQATMLLAAHWYNQREAVSATTLQDAPLAYAALVKPFCKLSDRPVDGDGYTYFVAE